MYIDLALIFSGLLMFMAVRVLTYKKKVNEFGEEMDWYEGLPFWADYPKWAKGLIGLLLAIVALVMAGPKSLFGAFVAFVVLSDTKRKSSTAEAPSLEPMRGSAPPPIPRPTEVPPPISKPIGVTDMEQHERNLERENLRNSDTIQEIEATSHPRSEFITRSDREYPRLEEYLKSLGLPGTFKNPDPNVEAAMHERALAYIEKHYITLSSSAALKKGIAELPPSAVSKLGGFKPLYFCCHSKFSLGIVANLACGMVIEPIFGHFTDYCG